MKYDYVAESGHTVHLDTMMKIILKNHAADGWLAVYYGIRTMPEDIEIPLLSIGRDATLATVAGHMRNRFPGALILYRNRSGHLTQAGE